MCLVEIHTLKNKRFTDGIVGMLELIRGALNFESCVGFNQGLDHENGTGDHVH
jgi:hypothetical protein